MDWVGELRSFLVKDELKYKHFQPERHRVMSNKPLWQRIVAGVERAEITIVDPFEYENQVLFDLQERGAEYGHDFDARALRELTSDAMLKGSPLRAAEISQYDWLANDFGTNTRQEFSTASIKKRIGGKRRDVVITAARAHAMVSPSEKLDLIRLCAGIDMPNLLDRVAMIRKLGRVFDVEHAKSVDVLNDFSDRIAEAAQLSHLALFDGARVVREEKSDNIDHIQGADIAAGWAVDFLMLSNGDYPGLARQFAWVSVNGIVIPG